MGLPQSKTINKEGTVPNNTRGLLKKVQWGFLLYKMTKERDTEAIIKKIGISSHTIVF